MRHKSVYFIIIFNLILSALIFFIHIYRNTAQTGGRQHKTPMARKLSEQSFLEARYVHTQIIFVLLLQYIVVGSMYRNYVRTCIVGSMYRGHAAPALCDFQDPIKPHWSTQCKKCNVVVEQLRATGFDQSISTFNLRIRLDDRLIDTVYMVLFYLLYFTVNILCFQTKLDSARGEYYWPTNGKLGNMLIEVAIESGKNLLLKPKFDGNRHSTEIGQLIYSSLLPPEGQQRKLTTVRMHGIKIVYSDLDL